MPDGLGRRVVEGRVDKDMTIEDAISLIRAKYEENMTKKWIRNPVAYTLYEVWKIMDSKVVLEPSTPTKPYDLLYEEGGANTT